MNPKIENACRLFLYKEKENIYYEQNKIKVLNKYI